jgi:hypothetical protein
MILTVNTDYFHTQHELLNFMLDKDGSYVGLELHIYMYNLNLCETSKSTLVLNLSNWVNGRIQIKRAEI